MKQKLKSFGGLLLGISLLFGLFLLVEWRPLYGIFMVIIIAPISAKLIDNFSKTCNDGE